MTGSPDTNGERLALAAAANVLFWSALSERILGRIWPGVALSITSMASAARGSSSPVFEIANLPGNVVAQVLRDPKTFARACDCPSEGPK